MFRILKVKQKNTQAHPTDPDGLIEMSRVVKKFHNTSGEITVLKGIDIVFKNGEFASIVGRSGSGKSTLLNMMTGIDHPSTGIVRVGDCVLSQMNEGQLSVWRGRNMGIVFQFFQLLPMLTLLENIMLPMDFCDTFAPGEREPRALELLSLVGLKGLEHKYPAAVSGGQQQSAAIARALANNPPILVADEPTGNLDSRTAERVLEIFEEQAQIGKTILMVTHDITLARRARRILIISDGELISEAITNTFPSLAHDKLLQLARTAATRAFSAGEILFQGDNLPELLIVRQGKVAVIAGGQWGAQIEADILTEGCVLSSENLKVLKRPIIGLRAETSGEAVLVQRLPDFKEIRAELAAQAQQRESVYARAKRQKGDRSLMHG